MIPADETFGGTWPHKAHFFKGAGFAQHYVEAGEGEPIICLHGEPTWGYLYRNFIPPLSATHRVIVPDHMGFGKSETPQDKTYTLKTHVENLTALIAHLKLEDITFVGQDWGGPIAAAYTVRNPDRVKRLCLMNTITGYGRAKEAGLTPWFSWIKRHHDAGTLDEVLGNVGSNVLSVMKIIGFQNSAAVDDDWIEAYSAPFPDKSSAIGAIEFPLDVLLGRIKDYVIEGAAGLEALKTKPAMLAVGLKDRGISPAYQIADFKGVFPDGPIVELPDAGHFCQEDAPETLVALIRQFIQMT
jgi:haloalkane dehalogenase